MLGEREEAREGRERRRLQGEHREAEEALCSRLRRAAAATDDGDVDDDDYVDEFMIKFRFSISNKVLLVVVSALARVKIQTRRSRFGIPVVIVQCIPRGTHRGGVNKFKITLTVQL